MWFKIYDSSGSATGRVNGRNVARFEAVGAGSAWEVKVYVTGATSYLPAAPASFATKAEALSAIDDLLLNGS